MKPNLNTNSQKKISNKTKWATINSKVNIEVVHVD